MASTDNTNLARVSQFLAQIPDGCSSDVVASALDLPIGDVLLARVTLAKQTAKAKADSGAS